MPLVSGQAKYDITERWPTTTSPDSVMPGSNCALASRPLSAKERQL